MLPVTVILHMHPHLSIVLYSLLLGCSTLNSGATLNPALVSPIPELISMEDSIVHYANIMQESQAVQARMDASRKVMEFLEKSLNHPGSWNHPFERIPQISVLTAAELSFRVFSWQLYLDPNNYQHFGFLQVNGKVPKTYPLRNRSAMITRPESHIGSPEEWYGLVYYRIYPFKSKGKKYWLLFGFDSYNERSSKKLIDVLHFDKSMNPVFGAPVFQFKDEDGIKIKEKHRVLLEFTASSKVSLNYDDHLDMIVFDHLMPFADDRKGQGLLFIPDGTYEGFKLKQGIWEHVDKVFHKTMDEAPVDFPVLDSRKNKDLFGKEKRK